MANLRDLCQNFRNWQMSGIPLTSLSLQDSKIASQSVDCRTYKPLKLMKCELANWASSEKYRNRGPIQVWHSSNQVARFHEKPVFRHCSLIENQGAYLDHLSTLKKTSEEIQNYAVFGVSLETLSLINSVLLNLKSLLQQKQTF